jgi:hypothetical protein
MKRALSARGALSLNISIASTALRETILALGVASAGIIIKPAHEF